MSKVAKDIGVIVLLIALFSLPSFMAPLEQQAAEAEQNEVSK